MRRGFRQLRTSLWKTDLEVKSRWSPEEALPSRTSSAIRTPGVQRGVAVTIVLYVGANQGDAKERGLYTL